MRHIEDTSSLDRATAFVITRTARRLRQDLWNFLKECGTDLTPEQYFLLFRLHEQDGRPMIELADQALMDRPNITRIVAGMEQKGLVRKTPDREDGRRILVFLKPKGRSVLEKIFVRLPEKRAAVLAGLSENEIAGLNRTLRKIEENLS